MKHHIKSNIFKLFIFTVLLLANAMCINNKKEKNNKNEQDIGFNILNKYKTTYSYLDFGNSVELSQANVSNNNDGLGDYEFRSYKSKSEDTIIFFSFYTYLADTSIRFDKYIKLYEDSNYIHGMLIGELDTIYFYKQSLCNPEIMYIYKGELYFKARMNCMTNDELDKYMLRDSLFLLTDTTGWRKFFPRVSTSGWKILKSNAQILMDSIPR